MIQVQLEGAVARIFLDRPQKANALHTPLLEDLLGSVEELARNDTLRVVVLGGRGASFCGGADVQELAALDAASAGRFVERIHAVCQAIRRLPLPVVARLHGAVIGAGLEIAAACDLRLAAAGTKFAMPEVRLGIPSVVEAALLPRLMGAGRAAWLVLTGEAIDARRAYEWGLVEQVCDDLDRGIEAVLASLLAADREALRVQKELLQLWEEAPLAASVATSIERFAGMPKHLKP
ncbi:MAG TPA: enoyl-CoA hydratase-related protein [Burkholderiales bacterium]|nr:enoyl-CoA hydratase-related protein [Burkholderiales bacterium]